MPSEIAAALLERRVTAGTVPGESGAERVARPKLSWYDLGRRGVDWVAALVLLLLATPVILVAALLVKLTSRGSPFYSQRRMGRGGKVFAIHKLRTMYQNSEDKTGPRWATAHDTRVTPVGRVLRRTHLDELPQLLTVLLGHMALVGPRPERPEFVSLLKKQIPGYAERLTVRPGITGLAQLHLPADTDLDSVRRKLRYDRYYIAHVTWKLDLKILLCTGCYLLGVPFYKSIRWFGVPNQKMIEAEEQGEAEPEVKPKEAVHPAA